MELPKIDVPGVSFFYDKSKRRFRMQFVRDGQRKTVTLKTTDHATAISEARDKAIRFDDRRYNPFAVKADRTVTVDKAVAEYLTSVSNLAEATVAKRTVILNTFRDSLPHGTGLRALTLDDLKDYYAAPHLKPYSKQTYYNTLNTWLHWCVSKSYLDASPLADAKRPKVAQGLPRYFTPDEFKTLLKYVRTEVVRQTTTLTGAAAQNGIEDYPDLLVIAVETGLRRAELLHFRWLDVDFKNGKSGVLHVRAYKYTNAKGKAKEFVPKGGKGRTIPLSPTARALLEGRQEQRRNEDDTEAVFVSKRTGKPRDAKTVTKTIGGFIKDAKLDPALHLHSTRHTFASWLASDGVPLIKIQKWLGHASIEQTMVYACLQPDATEWIGSRYHDDATALPGPAGVDRE